MKILIAIILCMSTTLVSLGQTKKVESKLSDVSKKNEASSLTKFNKLFAEEERDRAWLEQRLTLKLESLIKKREQILQLTKEAISEESEIELLREQIKKKLELIQLLRDLYLMSSPSNPL